MFRTVAEEKAARIQRDRKDAAAAYRTLGAIAGLRGPKRAFDAYARAVEFDNEDEESLLWLAWIAALVVVALKIWKVTRGRRLPAAAPGG